MPLYPQFTTYYLRLCLPFPAHANPRRSVHPFCFAPLASHLACFAPIHNVTTAPCISDTLFCIVNVFCKLSRSHACRTLSGLGSTRWCCTGEQHTSLQCSTVSGTCECSCQCVCVTWPRVRSVLEARARSESAATTAYQRCGEGKGAAQQVRLARLLSPPASQSCGQGRGADVPRVCVGRTCCRSCSMPSCAASLLLIPSAE